MTKFMPPRFKIIEHAPIIHWNTDAIIGSRETVVNTAYTLAYAERLADRLNYDYRDADMPFYRVKDTRPASKVVTNWIDTIGLPF